MFLFSIPDSTIVRNHNIALFLTMEHHPDWFYDDFKIYVAYGCPPYCIWNGGRASDKGESNLQKWQSDVLAMYSQFNVKYRLTFTNFLLEPAHLFDSYCNEVAKIHNDIGGYVMVSTPLMAKYMERYPNLEICWSTTTDFGKTQAEQIAKMDELSEKHIVVPYYMYNNTETLWKLKHPENIEVLVDEKCMNNCPRRHEHEANANRYNLFQTDVSPSCLMEGVADFTGPRMHRINRDMLQDYAAHGINHFKIEGRKDNDISSAYMVYFVRREHYIDFVSFRKELMELDK